MYLETFKVEACDRAVIEQKRRMSDSKPKAVRDVGDLALVARIVEILSLLPDEGEEMIKMGDVPTIETRLYSGGSEIGHFTFYGKRLKAPDTAFYSGSPPAEKDLFDLLESIAAGRPRKS